MKKSINSLVFSTNYRSDKGLTIFEYIISIAALGSIIFAVTDVIVAEIQFYLHHLVIDFANQLKPF